MVCLGRRYHFKFFKGFLPQILLGPFLNTLSQMNMAALLLYLVPLESFQEKKISWRIYGELKGLNNIFITNCKHEIFFIEESWHQLLHEYRVTKSFSRI